MPRTITVAAAQMGPIAHAPTNPGGPASREPALARLLTLLEDAAAQGAQLVVFPELALTTFFPRALLTDAADVAALFEPESDAPGAPSIVDSPHLQPLLARASALGVDVSIGYAERWTDAAAPQTTTDYNTAIYYSARTGAVVAKYRKVHLPGRTTMLPPGSAQQLEKHYFTPGNLGFQAFRIPGVYDDSAGHNTPQPIAGMLICNDRRWAEAWRCLGLQGVELVLCGYNTSDYKPQEPGSVQEQTELALLHHHTSCQAGSYTNACFSVHVAKAGVEAEGAGGGLIGGTVIYDPLGRKVGETATLGDELLVATLDLDMCAQPKQTIFNFANHRRVEHYARIIEQVGVVEPPL
ncbi:n-carbamyl-d-amino acid amidohydrolase [Sporothrix brasiliensis 5110]|uniref:N-carbamyl-d-amino acid amidohydrolase n=1 Tax=Sporothrix brasiliensis 5110 TaxID=1398154 RepID=A0A0C2IXT5_9PEZI|nr:n-carbamyl-d-amino acid amidohydrolase [Sporothrix brasiliensis 5110]KIH93941.1 n-carbamyl-d-amino acid amidohydrolase [Sporothrix brasiliensis 5110]